MQEQSEESPQSVRERLRQERMKRRVSQTQISRRLSPAAQAARAEESKSLVNGNNLLAGAPLPNEVQEKKRFQLRAPQQQQPAAPKAPPPVDVKKLAAAVEENMKALTVLMEDELNFLGRQDMDGLISLRKEKAKLVREYQEHMVLIHQRPYLIRSAPVDVRTNLRKTGEVLADVASRNAAMLKAAITATQNMLQIIIDAAREGLKTTDCYCDPRKKKNMHNIYSPICDPVAVVRTA